MQSGHSGPSCTRRPRSTSPARVVVLFCRDPQNEARAKRLPARAAHLFRRILHDWRARAHEAGARLILVAPAESLSRLQGEAPDALVAEQSHGTFAERLDAALALAHQAAGGPAIVAPGDTAPLTLGDLNRAFGRLEEEPATLVMAPADDGGVNAIGLTRPAPGLFERVDWMTARVHTQLQAAAARLGLPLFELGAAPDLDTAADLPALASVARWHPIWRPYRRLVQSLTTAARPFDTRSWVVWSPWVPAPDEPRGPPLRLEA